MILVLDNYDSFVHNLSRYIQELGHTTVIYRSDRLSIADIEALTLDAIVISPGPCTPTEAGISLEVVKQLGSKIPILGICLGHQTIAQALGGTIQKAQAPAHGKTKLIRHTSEGIFADLPSPIRVGCYHSLIVATENLPEDLIVTSYSEEGEIMSLQHRTYKIHGVQFHPESVLTDFGYEFIKSFLAIIA